MSSSDFNHFPQLAQAYAKACSQTVRKVALDIQKDAVDLAPVDTGFLRNSIYTVTSASSSYGKAGTGKDLRMLDELPEPPDEYTAYVAVGAEYGEYVEYGTIYMAPQPFFVQACEWGQGALSDAMALIEARMKELSGP